MAFATRKVVKGPKGKPHIMFVDPATGEPIPHSEIGDYTLIEQGNNLDIPSHTKKALEGDLGGFAGEGKESDEDWGHKYQDEDPAPDIGERTHQNNFGYINKPALVSLLSHAPGLLGTFGKGINVAINVNNLSAVNAARGSIGLAPITGKAAFKSAIQDNKGYVGDIVAGDTQYAVGLESLSPTGRTTLTPSEATSRLTKASLAGKESREATPQEAKAAVKAHTAEFGPIKDLTSPKGIAKAVVDSLLDTISPAETAEGRSPEDTTPVAPDDHPENQGLVGAPSDDTTLVDTTETGSIQNEQKGLAPYVEAYGSKRPETPTNPNLINLVQQAVTDVLGPDHTIIGVSGKGEYGSSRHRGGDAVDFQVQGPDGKIISDRNVINQIGEALGRVGITGAGAGYEGMGRSIHADLAKGLETAWGDPGFIKSFNSGQQQSGIQGHSEVGRLPDNVPTPGPPGTGLAGAPGAPGTGGGTSGGEPSSGSIADAFIEGEITESNEPGEPGQLSFVPQPTPSAPESNEQGTQPVPAPSPTQTPGQTSGQVGQGFAGGQGQGGSGGSGGSGGQNGQGGDGNLGGGGRGIPEEVIPLLTLMIAGELGQDTINGIRTGNPAARQVARSEVADIAATVKNRAQSNQLKGNPDPYKAVMNPGHYNSLKPENLNTTRTNASIAGAFIEDAIRDYNKGELTGNAPNATHYFNPDIVNPTWSENVTGPAIDSGEHRFVIANQKNSTTPEFTPALPTVNAPTPSGRPEQQTTETETEIETPEVQTTSNINQENEQSRTVEALNAAPVDRDIERSDLSAPTTDLSPEEVNAALSKSNISIVTPEQAGLTGKTTSTTPSINDVQSFTTIGPNQGIANNSVNTTSVGREGLISSVAGPLSNAPGAGSGKQANAGLVGLTDLSTLGIAAGIAGTGIGPSFSQSPAGLSAGTGRGFAAGQLGTSPGILGPAPDTLFGGTTGVNSMRSGTGILDNVSISPSVAVDQNGVAVNSAVGMSSAPSGFGTPGSLGMASGGGFGHQGNAGIGMGVGNTVGTMSSTAGMNAAQASFGGVSAGSLAGSASGLGSGLGAAGNDAAYGGGFSGAAGSYGGGGNVGSSYGGGQASTAGNSVGGVGFGGHSAGSLSGSASGAGTGLGAVGSSGNTGGFSPNNGIQGSGFSGNVGSGSSGHASGPGSIGHGNSTEGTANATPSLGGPADNW